jgi:oligopeptide/dipeptide ABC transporter ATP-binding protein
MGKQPDVFAVDAASLRVAPGKTVGVLGESGSGKSTLAASLLAMLPRNAVVDGGAVLWRGRNLLETDRRELARVRGGEVSLIFQEPSLALHPTMRVGLQIEEVLRAHTRQSKSGREREVRDLLSAIFGTDVDRIYRSYPHQLSGGQRQRIAIAQAIVCKPTLLIADEPTASLDSVSQREILDLLTKLKKQRKLAILFITHAVELLNGFADRVAVMYGGRIVEEGTAASVLGSPQHPYTVALLKCRPAFERMKDWPAGALLPIIQGDPPELSKKIQGCTFEPRCAEKMQICRERTPEFSTTQDDGRVRCFKFGG